MLLAFEIVIILVLIGINGLFSMSELALISARRARLAVLERKGQAGAAAARHLVEDPQRFLPTVQVGVTLISVLTGVFGGARVAERIAVLLGTIPLVRPAADTLAIVLVVVVTTYLTLVLGELVPKQLALRRPELVATRVARPLGWMASASAPAVWLLGASTALVLRLLGQSRATRQTVTEEELRALLAEGAQTGVLEAEERDMIERVLRLADKPVRAIMTPRTELVWIDRTDPPRDIIATLRDAPHSRFVVCDGTVDNVIGLVLAKDILDRILAGGELSLAAALRQPMILPDTISALDGLERLRNDQLGMALVMDEYGNFEGVVTAADMLQAIVGDPSEPAPADGTAAIPSSGEPLLLDGLLAVDEVKARLDLPDLPDPGTYHTLGGLLLALLRRVPRAGDRIVFAGWRFEVLEMDGRRVARVRVSRDATAALTPAHAGN